MTPTRPVRAATADEIAGALYREQGFLILASAKELPLGKVIRPSQVNDAIARGLTTALRIAGAATEIEYLAQRQLAARLFGAIGPAATGRHFFYRVEAD